MQKAIRSLLDAIIELITNSDDSYERLNNFIKQYVGDIKIDYQKGNQKNKSILTIRDKAEGMSAQKLDKVLREHGNEIKSGGASRGYFGRGLIDCHSIGDLTIYSVDKGDPKKCIITKLEHRSQKYDEPQCVDFNQKLRQETGIRKHGTYIKLEIPIKSPAEYSPRADNLKKQIGSHYSLRNILWHQKGDFQGTLNLKFNDEKITYHPPFGDEIYKNYKYKVMSRKGRDIYAFFDLYKSPTELQGTSDESLNHYGILIQAKKAIHDKSFLSSKYKDHPERKKYFGHLRCDHIDELLKEYYENDMNSGDFETDNSISLVNDERKGIRSDHPFVKLLFEEPSKLLDQEIKKDVEKNTGNLTNQTLKEQNKKFTDEFDKMVEDMVESQNDIGSSKKTWYAAGTFKIEVGKPGEIRLYAKSNQLIQGNDVDIVISESHKSYIKLKKNKITLIESDTKPGYSKGKLQFDTIKENKKITIEFRYDNQIKTTISINIFKPISRSFKNNIEFEDSVYQVKEKGSRTLKVFAKYPSLVKKNNTIAKVIVGDQNIIAAPTSCKFNIVEGTNYSEATIQIKGIRVNDTTNLIVHLGDDTAETYVEVADKPDPEGAKIKHEIQFVDYSLGDDVRAEWNPNEPHILNITTAHKVVRKYLGKRIGENFEKQSSPEWIIFQNEIRAEKFAQKMMSYKAYDQPDEYKELLEKNEVSEIIQQSIYIYNHIKRKLILISHKG